MSEAPVIARLPRMTASEFWTGPGSAREPVIVENSVPEWRHADGWSFDYLRSAIGHRQGSLNRGYFDRGPASTVPMTEILTAIETGSSIDGHDNPYLRNVDIWNDLPELVKDLSPRLAYVVPNWMSCRFLPKFVPDGLVEFFIGGAGAAFPKLHVDTHGTHAFITQLYGRKHIVVAPPSSTAGLTEAFGDPENFTLDCDAATRNRLAIVETTLLPGDTLFVPAGWWHTTYMTELAISVSSNCVNRSNWHDYVNAITRNTSGYKKPIKVGLLSILGWLLRIEDRLGSRVLYRDYD